MVFVVVVRPSRDGQDTDADDLPGFDFFCQREEDVLADVEGGDAERRSDEFDEVVLLLEDRRDRETG